MAVFKITQLIIFILVIAISILIYVSIPKDQCQRFAEQSQSFIHGKLDINSRIDSVRYNGKYYWPQGPFPSIILMPFQLIFGPSFNQTSMQPILIVLLSYFLYKLAGLKKFTSTDCLKLVYAFLFGSVAFGIIIKPCYSLYAHIVTMTLLAGLLLEFETKRRWFIMGILSASVLATRPTASLIILVILYYILQLNQSARKYYHLIIFILPLLSTAVLLLWFNQTRFQNPFDTGYGINDVGEYLNSLRQNGVFNLEHVPANFYFYFINPVTLVTKQSTGLAFPYLAYNPVGLSFFIVSPFFLYALKSLRKPVILIRLYWIVLFVALLILLSYYSTGWVQFGPRFASDIMPVLYLLTLYAFPTAHLSPMQTKLIFLSSLINAYLLFTSFFQLNIY